MEVLFRCLRGPALQWLKDQPKFTSLNDFKIAMAKAFPEPAANPDPVIINPSPRFHTCPECDAQFSSTSRLLAHTQKGCSKSFTCKHCEEAFASNNKLHEHVRLHHIRKSYSNKTLGQRFAERGGSHINLPISRSTSPTTSRSMTASAEPSYLSITMTKAQAARPIEPPAGPSITPTNLAVLAASKSPHPHRHTRMPSTPPPSPPRTSILSHTTPKAYMSMGDLFEMFAGISSRKSKNIMQRRPTSPCSPEPRQTRTKPLCQQGPKDTAMLAGRQSRRSLNAIRKRMGSPLSSMSGPAKITSYFKPAGQSSKSSKSSAFTSCPCPAPRAYFPANRAAGTPQYQQTATGEASNQRESKPFEIQSPCTSQQGYIAAAGVYHTNKGIRVGTPLTNAGGYNSVKSSVKLFKSPKFSRKLKSSISSSRPSSAPRACFPANQAAGTPQYQHIATGKAKLPKSLKSAVFISSPSSALRSSLPANHDSVMPQMLTSVPSEPTSFAP